MVKARTNISIEPEILKEATDKQINISAVSQEAIRRKLGKVQIEIDIETDYCEFCKKEEKKATAKDLKGLTFLVPNEKWICRSCLMRKSIVSR